MTHAKIIQELLSNSKTWKMELLKNCPQHIPKLVDLVFDEWSIYDATLTKEQLRDSFTKRLNDSKLPLTVVALHNGSPLGFVSLKEKDHEEFNYLSNGNPWLGTLLVIQEERNNGLGKELLKMASIIAKGLGHSSIFLYISNPDCLKWYYARGAKFIQSQTFRDHTISILQIPLK